MCVEKEYTPSDAICSHICAKVIELIEAEWRIYASVN